MNNGTKTQCFNLKSDELRNPRSWHALTCSIIKFPIKKTFYKY